MADFLSRPASGGLHCAKSDPPGMKGLHKRREAIAFFLMFLYVFVLIFVSIQN